jgi:hypothetical protein
MGDHAGESLEVKVLAGEAKAESDPSGGRTNRQVVAKANCSEAPKYRPHVKRIVGMLGKPNPLSLGEGQRWWRRNWMNAATDFPGVSEGDMSRRISSESSDPLVGGLGAPAQPRRFV